MPVQHRISITSTVGGLNNGGNRNAMRTCPMVREPDIDIKDSKSSEIMPLLAQNTLRMLFLQLCSRSGSRRGDGRRNDRRWLHDIRRKRDGSQASAVAVITLNGNGSQTRSLPQDIAPLGSDGHALCSRYQDRWHPRGCGRRLRLDGLWVCIEAYGTRG